MSRDDPSADLTTTLLRLLVGSVVVGSDLTLSALLSAAEAGNTEDGEDDEARPLHESTVIRTRQALIGLLFEAYGGARRGISTAGRAVSTAGRFWRALARPIVRSRAMDPVRRPYDFLVGRGSEELERWAQIGRAEEDRSREVVRRLSMAPVEEIVSYLQDNPQLERLVRRQAESLLRQLDNDPTLTDLVREQGDRYVEHLQDHPDAIQQLVRGQSVGMAAELADTVRRRTVSADAWLERLVRAALGRTPREELPGHRPRSVPTRHRRNRPVAESASDGIRGDYAGFVSRLSAFAIDAAIIAALTVVVSWAAVSLLGYVQVDVRDCPPLSGELDVLAWGCHLALWSGVALGAVFPTVYTLFFWSATGQTPGKAVMGVRIVRLDGRRMGLWTSILRALGYSLSLATLGLGFVWILFDNRRQDLADKLAGTCVVYTWNG